MAEPDLEIILYSQTILHGLNVAYNFLSLRKDLVFTHFSWKKMKSHEMTCLSPLLREALWWVFSFIF